MQHKQVTLLILFPVYVTNVLQISTTTGLLNNARIAPLDAPLVKKSMALSQLLAGLRDGSLTLGTTCAMPLVLQANIGTLLTCNVLTVLNIAPHAITMELWLFKQLKLDTQ